MQPGRPGDLLMVLEEVRAGVIRHRQEHQENPDRAYLERCARATIEALKMWLGDIPVAEWPIEEIH